MRISPAFFGTLLFVTSTVAFSAAPCAATPAAAVKAYEEGLVREAAVGFRVVRLREDAQLGVAWADVKRCDHPEWPGVTVAAARGMAAPVTQSVQKVAAQVTVRAGERVRVWRQDANIRLEMAAVSDEGGVVGQRVRMHVVTVDGEPVRYVFGLVRGPADVEME